jgi:DNA helicase-2/ATP-dependent DNA helicase PcrA
MNLDILEGLNPAQRKAVESVNGPLLIVAGPGSGKTRVIVHRIVYLTNSCDVDPHRIISVTFTNKAAKEMKHRLTELMGHRAHELTAGTFHSICANILRRDGSHIGLDRSYTIYDDDDQIKLIKTILEDMSIDPDRHHPRAILSYISNAKSQLLDISLSRQFATNYADEIKQRVYERYQQRLSQNNALDFDDLLLSTYHLFQQTPHILKQYQSRYQHVLVDEFQDTNVAQYSLARMLTGEHRNICVVGDPDQSIYSWRNADLRNILSFQEDYPDATVIKLEENYRSTGTILEASRTLISANRERIQNNLWTSNPNGEPVVVSEAYNDEEEADMVLQEVGRLVKDKGYKLEDFAVMYRVNAQSRSLEMACRRSGMPYRLIGALRFYQRREVKDIISYLRILQNPYDDVSILRVINIPTRGIGQRTVKELTKYARQLDMPIYPALQVLVNKYNNKNEMAAIPGLTSRTMRALTSFLDLINKLIGQARNMDASQALDFTLDSIAYLQYIELLENGGDRLDNLQELRREAHEFTLKVPPGTLEDYLEQLALVSAVDNLEKSDDALTLLTLHMAKGLEFAVVFIVGMEEGLLPHSRSIDDPREVEEERRLCYVGMTRAQERIYLFRTFKRYLMGNNTTREPSRFLKDIPPHLLASPFKKDFRSPANHTKVSTPVTVQIPLESGDKVRHDTFGDGIVINCAPADQDYVVTVAFKGTHGIKRLMLSFAPLKVLN